MKNEYIFYKKNKINFLARVYLDSDVIIYDLNTCKLEEDKFFIKSNFFFII